MRYKPIRTIKFWGGLALGLIVFGFAFWGIDFALGPGDMGLKVVLLIPVILFSALFLLMVYGALTTYYEINGDNLVINWAFRHIVIPWEDVNNVIRVDGDANLFSIFAFSWPGFQVGQYAARALGAVQIYAGEPGSSFLYIKTNKGMFGIIPRDLVKATEEIVLRSAKELEILDMNATPPEVKGFTVLEDGIYQLLYKANLTLFMIFAFLLALLFPNSGADNFVMIFLVLSLGLLFFCISIAVRIYQFSESGGYILLIISLIVTATFLVLSLREVLLSRITG